MVTVALMVVLLWAAFAAGRAGSSASTRMAAGPPVGHVTVVPGDTLWSLATRSDPERDPREVVRHIRRLNRLESPTLHPGQQLLTPGTDAAAVDH